MYLITGKGPNAPLHFLAQLGLVPRGLIPHSQKNLLEKLLWVTPTQVMCLVDFLSLHLELLYLHTYRVVLCIT